MKTSKAITADYGKIELKWQIFDGETHLSVWPALRVLDGTDVTFVRDS